MDINFFRQKLSRYFSTVHPECDPSVVKEADFVGSTSQLITYVNEASNWAKVVVGTEYNLVNRMRDWIPMYKVLQTRVSTMNETYFRRSIWCFKSIDEG